MPSTKIKKIKQPLFHEPITFQSIAIFMWSIQISVFPVIVFIFKYE